MWLAPGSGVAAPRADRVRDGASRYEPPGATGSVKGAAPAEPAGRGRLWAPRASGRTCTVAARTHGRYRHRVDAGRVLAAALADELPGPGASTGRALLPGALVLGLPRGGVPVAAEVARALDAEMDVLLVRKLGVPGHEELAMGAIASDGVELLDRSVVHELGITPEEVAAVVDRERLVLARRAEAYRGDRPAPSVAGRLVVVVDDGLATGSTMLAALTAVAAIDERPPTLLVAAAPVGARAAVHRVAEVADQVVCPLVPEAFVAVGRWYDAFDPTTDDEVRAALARGQDGGAADPPPRSPSS